MLLQEKATAVANRLKSSQGVPDLVAFDPTFLAAVLGLLSQFIQALANCNKTPAQAAEVAGNPGFVNTLRARRLARRQLRLHPAADVYAAQIVRAALEEGAAVTAQDMATLYQEVGK